MAEEAPPDVKLVQVKPSKDAENDFSLNDCEKHDVVKPKVAVSNTDKKFFPVQAPTHDDERAKIESSFHEVELKMSDQARIANMFLAKPAKTEDTEQKSTVNVEPSEKVTEAKDGKRKKKKIWKKPNSVLPLDATKQGKAKEEQIVQEPHVEIDTGEPTKEKKKKKSKAKKKRKKKENKTTEKEQEVKEEIQQTGEVIETKPVSPTASASNHQKLPCCFGFIATWLAKRKEKRREKKRKAIASRATPSPPPLVEYEHKTAKGGEAFTIQVDNRPISIKKPLLPPIKQTPGPIRRAVDVKLENAKCKRAEELAKKKDVAKKHEKKRTKCKERRAESDYQFRQKADTNIKQKQACAERNRDARSRCQTKSRIIFVEPYADPSAEAIAEPSRESSFWSITGPSFESEDDQEAWHVDDDVDMFFF